MQYNIKKKEELPELVQEEPTNPLMRKKKTPEELAKEAEMEEEDEFTSEYYDVIPTSMMINNFSIKNLAQRR